MSDLEEIEDLEEVPYWQVEPPVKVVHELFPEEAITEENNDSNNDDNVYIQEIDKGHNVHIVHDQDLREIRRIKYGRLEPTMKRVDINTMAELVEWIQTYTKYMQGEWDNANTRGIAEILFFDVFKNGFSTLVGRPRDTGKSKISVAVYACIIANYWLPVSAIVNGSKAKRRIFNGVYSVLASSKFRKDYGDIIQSRSRSEGFMELKGEILDELYDLTGYVTDDPIIQISQYSGIIGSHPYVAFLEDMLQSEFKSPESNEYMLYEVYDAIINRLTDRKGGTFTRKGKEDLYSNLPARGVTLSAEKCIKLISGYFPTVDNLVFDENNVPIDLIIPEGCEFEIIDRPGWTVKSVLLERTRALLDKKSFRKWSREMQNDIIALEGNYFDKDKWREIPRLPIDAIKGSCYLIYDPSIGKTSKADFACLYVAMIYAGRLYNPITELHKGLTLDQQVWLLKFYVNWLNPVVPPLVEDVLGQVWLHQRASKSIALSSWDRPRSVKKTEWIDGLSFPYTRDLMLKSDTMLSGVQIPGHRCTPKMCGNSPNEVSLDQYIEYDQTDSDDQRKDDYLDCEAEAWRRLKHHFIVEDGITAETGF